MRGVSSGGDETPRCRAPLYALFGANAVSLSGNVMTYISVPWFVLETTGSAAKTGLVAFFTLVPAVLAAFFGGALVDRLGLKRSSVLADVASGLAVAAIPLLYGVGLLGFPALLALVFLGALLDAPGGTAREALVPDLASEAGMGLERAAALGDSVSRGSRLLGAPLAGALIAWLGPAAVLWIDAGTFAVSALLVALLVPPPPPKPAPDTPTTYLGDLRGGLRFIRRDPLVLTIVATVMITNMLDTAFSAVVMPVYARQVFGSALDLGLTIAAFGAGAVLGSLAYGAVGRKLPRRPVFIAMFVIVGLRYWVLAGRPPFPVFLAVNALTGLAAGPLNPILSAVQYERVPAEMRGRVFGAVTAGVFLAMPAGVLVAGYAVEWAGLRPTLLALAACYLAATLSLAFSRALRGMDAPAPTTEVATHRL